MPKKEPTPSFVYTLKLHYCKSQERRLDKVFRAVNNLYNDLVRDRKKAYEKVKESDEYRAVQDQMRSVYEDKTKTKAQIAKELKPLGKQRTQILQDAGISKYGFHHESIRFRLQYGKLINSQVGKCIANEVWQKFEKYMYGAGKHLHFRSWQDCRSFESSTPSQGIVFKGTRVMIGSGFEIKVKRTGSDYERECLACRVKYCRIVRIPWKNGWLYKLQLVLEGTPPVICGHGTNTPKHTLGEGRVGIDIGMKDVAVSGDSDAMVPILAPNAQNTDAEIKQIQQRLERMRRAANPDFFDDKGCIVPVNKLPQDRLTKHGKRRWICSGNYRRLDQRRRYLQAKLARIRKHDHQTLANRILALGDTFFVEKMRWQGLAKKAKLQKKENGEYKKRKRFGKSVLMRAPGMLMTVLKEKVERGGGQFFEIDTWNAKASQYNHLTGEYRKVPLGQRWKAFRWNAGVYIIQRDLYSAFLLSCTNPELNGFIQKMCERKFGNFVVYHERAVHDREQTDNMYRRSREKFTEGVIPQGQMRFE